MADKLPSLAILGVLIAGCGCPAEPDPKGPTSGTGVTAPDGQKTDPSGNHDPGDGQGPPHGKKPDGPAKPAQKPDGGRKAKPAEKPDGAQKPAGKEKPAEKPSGPTHGLPLEIDLTAPEVPQKLQGPTPPEQLKKK